VSNDDQLFRAVAELARKASAECGLPRDVAVDLAQQAYAHYLQHPSGGVDLADWIHKAASNERQRRRRQSQCPSQQRTGAKAPTLCGGLAVWVEGASSSHEYLLKLHAAAKVVAFDPGTLEERQVRPFVLAYIEGMEIDDIRILLRLDTLKATQKRLRRISRRIEVRVIDELRLHVSEFVLARVLTRPGSRAGKNSTHASCFASTVCEALMGGFEAIASRGPGHHTS